MAETLELALLGNPELRLAGQPLPRLRSAKTYAMLYYLAATRRAQPRTVLASLFWGDVDEYYARRNFNRTLSDLTQFVGDHLVVERQTITFARSQPHWLDVEQLETAVTTPPTEQGVTALTAAVNLYRGDFLEGFTIQDAPEFEQWVLSERTRLRASALQLLHNLAQLSIEQGDLTRAMNNIRRILQLEPWREEAHRQLMLLLAQSGQRSAALAQYELCRQALRSELNVEPDAATLDLVASIRAGSIDRETRGEDKETRKQEDTKGEVSPSPSPPLPVSLSPSPLHNLPSQRTPFVGRAAELAEITRLLVEEDACRLLTLVGPGGMGKTRLALKVAEGIVASPAFQQNFGDGIYFVPLENVNDANGLVSAVIAAISEESGLRLRAETSLQEQLLHFLRAKAMLLVLDSFEHLVNQAVLLSDLLVAVPRLKILVTARETVGLQEAWFYPLLGLSIPQQKQPERKTQQGEYDAVRLFAQCARRTRPDFALEADRSAVLRICTLVEGMPLGIELAAAWHKVMTCAQIAQEIARGLDFLTARYQNIPVRHRSMRAVIDHSWALLSAEEGDAFVRLSIFRGRFRQEAANAITGTSLFTLAALAEKALVRVTPDGHYQLHELTRQYAEEKLTSTARTTLRDAHATYYAELLHRQKPLLFTREHRQVWGTVGGELDNIRHAWEWLIAAASTGRQDLPVTVLLRHMAEVLANYYLFQSLGLPGHALFANACQVLEAAGWATNGATDGGQHSSQATLVHIQLLTGLFHFDLGHYRTGLAVATQALATCRTLGLEEDLLLALILYGRIQMRRGVPDEAVPHLQEALALAQRLGLSHRSAETLLSLGMVASNVGRYTDAQDYMRQALTLSQEIGYRPWVARMLTNLGATYSRQRDYQQARPYYEQALTIAQEEGDQNFVMVNNSNLGGVYSGFGQHELAVTYYQRSLTMARSLSDERWIAVNLNGLATTYLEMGDLTAAERTLREALTVGQESHSPPDTLGSIALLGHLFARRGRLEAALRALAFAEQHPATMARDLLYNQPFLAELRSELAPILFEQAAAWAATQTLDGVVRWLLYGDPTFSTAKHLPL